MMSTNPPRRRIFATPANKPRLLIVTDSVERAVQLRAALEAHADCVTVAVTAHELRCACRHGPTLAVVDVGPERIVETLEILRSCRGCAAISLLVEHGRLAAASDFAGVLPQYRAMPCGYDDLLRLVRRRAAPHEMPSAKRLL